MRHLAALRLVRESGEILERQYTVKDYFSICLLLWGALLLCKLLSNIVTCNWSASLLRRLKVAAIGPRSWKHTEEADVWRRRVHWR